MIELDRKRPPASDMWRNEAHVPLDVVRIERWDPVSASFIVIVGRDGRRTGQRDIDQTRGRSSNVLLPESVPQVWGDALPEGMRAQSEVPPRAADVGHAEREEDAEF